MPDFPKILHVVLLILVVILSFNLIIFVHELGHFLAAKWRGLQVDRFQIWFGKPIWKKELGGVQYGLGWIPAGGFVALPQMAPMEAIEGSNSEGRQLPPIKPIDKIIVAFAGPFFSISLALLAACVVTAIGKPADVVPSQFVGSVLKDSPAEQAGIRVGDKIIAVNGEPVNGFTGHLDSIFERIILSKGKDITFTVERKGESAPLTLTSTFKIEETKWFQRRALRRVGIGPEVEHMEIGEVSEGSPAARAGLQAGDRLLQIDGNNIFNADEFLRLVKAAETRPFVIDYERDGKPAKVTLQAEVPVSPDGKPPMVGILPDEVSFVDSRMIHPSAFKQVGDSLNMMWMTISSVVSKDSSIGIDHLSGPVGIAKVKYAMLEMDHPFNRLLAFFVLFNVNLAVLNMMPFPVLDGGHIVLALMESVARRPVKAKFLEYLQMGFAMLLIGVMLYVTSKDIGDGFGRGADPAQKVIFKKP
jgi:regulator of sigma E protease